MRIGIIAALAPPPWAEFWEKFLRELGADTLRPEQAPPRAAPHLDFAPCLAVTRIASGLALLKRETDRIILPRLADLHAPPEPSRGSSLDCPWLVDLAATMQAMLPGLPPIHVLPAHLDGRASVAAATLARALGRAEASARRAFTRAELALTRPRPAELRPGTIAILGQPYLLADPALRASLTAATTRPLYFQDELTGEILAAEGARHPTPSPLSTDQEMTAAMSYLDRHPGVAGILAIVSTNCPPIPRLVDRLFTGARRPVQVALVESAEALTGPLARLEERIEARARRP